MADTQWQNVKLENVIPDAIKQTADTVETIVNALRTALTIQITALKFIASLSVDLLNAEALIIKAAVAAINEALSPLLDEAKAHLLVVPFRKQTNYRLADPEYFRSWQFTDSDNGPPIDATAAAKEQYLTEKLRFINFYRGGNAGYLRTVMETLDDQGDSQRPHYDENNAIFAHVWVAGASDVVGIIDALLTLEGLFGISLKSNSFVPRNLVRTPQDVTAKQVLTPSGRMGALLSWTPPVSETSFPEFGNIFMKLHEIAIIRSTDPEALVSRNWTDLFGDTQPTPMASNATDDDTTQVVSQNQKNRIIARFRNDGVRCTYVDDDAALEKNVDYYYAVSYRYAVYLPEGVASPGKPVIDGYAILDYKLLSSIQTIRLTATAPESTQGVKPDWIATPDALSLIPDLKYYVTVLQTYLEAMSNQAIGGSSALSSYIAFLEAEIERYDDLVRQITARIQKLIGLLKTPEAGIYTTTIMLEKGGTDAFVRELTRRMLDDTDPSAPPFHTGTEFVAGIVLLAGAPNFSQLSAIQTFINLLFGTTGNIQTAFEAAVDSIEKVITEQETTPAEPLTKAPSTQTFDKGLNPVNPTDPNAKIPFDDA